MDCSQRRGRFGAEGNGNRFEKSDGQQWNRQKHGKQALNLFVTYHRFGLERLTQLTKILLHRGHVVMIFCIVMLHQVLYQ